MEHILAFLLLPSLVTTANLRRDNLNRHDFSSYRETSTENDKLNWLTRKLINPDRETSTENDDLNRQDFGSYRETSAENDKLNWLTRKPFDPDTETSTEKRIFYGVPSSGEKRKRSAVPRARSIWNVNQVGYNGHEEWNDELAGSFSKRQYITPNDCAIAEILNRKLPKNCSTSKPLGAFGGVALGLSKSLWLKNCKGSNKKGKLRPEYCQTDLFPETTTQEETDKVNQKVRIPFGAAGYEFALSEWRRENCKGKLRHPFCQTGLVPETTTQKETDKINQKGLAPETTTQKVTQSVNQKVPLPESETSKTTDNLNQKVPTSETETSNTTDNLNQTVPTPETETSNTRGNQNQTVPTPETETSNTTDYLKQTVPTPETETSKTTDYLNQKVPTSETETSNTTDNLNQTVHTPETETSNTTDNLNQTGPTPETETSNTTDNLNQTVPTPETETSNTTDFLNQKVPTPETETSNTTTDNLNQKVPIPETETSNTTDNLNQKVLTPETETSKKADNLNQKVLTPETETSKKADNLNKKDSWPSGRYALLSTQDGCPDAQNSNMCNRSTTFIASSFSSSSDKNQHGFGGYHYDYQKTVVFSFCQNNGDEKNEDSLPKGSYCVHAAPTCPEHFQANTLLFQVPETFQAFGVHAFPPIIHGKPSLAFCCRNDGDARVPVVLPNTKSFYLYRRGGQCQEVVGTTVTRKVMDIFAMATGRRSSVFASSLSLMPDGKLKDVVSFELCYYTPVVT